MEKPFISRPRINFFRLILMSKSFSPVEMLVSLSLGDSIGLGDVCCCCPFKSAVLKDGCVMRDSFLVGTGSP